MNNKEFKKYKKSIEKSKLFDAKYYLRENHDARIASEIPLDHFVKYGLDQDRKPNAEFDPAWYREYYLDVREDGAYPFIHYILFGRKENRFMNADEQKEYEVHLETFDEEFYKNSYDDLKGQDEDFSPLLHYIRYGKKEGREYTVKKNENSVQEIEIIDEEIKLSNSDIGKTEANKFDIDYYLEKNPDVKNANLDPEQHYYQFGEQEGRKPNKYFDPVFYYQLNSDVRTIGMSAFQHFCQSGHSEGRLSQLKSSNDDRIVDITKRTLLFVGHDGIQAGAQVLLLEIIKWFYFHTNRKIKIVLLDFGPLTSEYVKYAEVYVLSKQIIDDINGFTKFLNEDFEFVYLSTVVSGKFLKLCKEHEILLNTNIIANIHEMEKVLAIYESELSELQKSVTHWISGSDETTKILLEKYNISIEQLTTIPAFIDPIADKDANENIFKENARNRLSLNKDSFVVMGCGTAYWRKGPDIFVDTAKKLHKLSNEDIQFVWIGDGEDKESLENSLSMEDKTYIHFIGHQDNVEVLLAAADIFYLSSREDPFPLVSLLAAQHYVPTICFSPATGITRFVRNDAGISLSEVSSDLAAEAINDLINDRNKLGLLAKEAHDRLFESYTSDVKMVETYVTLQKYTTYTPSVSVIIPFYNHEKYLKERIDSILNQQIKDIEIIALDDCSTDNSLEQVKPYLKDARISLYENTVNSGSPFKQWKKGVELAKSEIVWIAEGDDTCSENFLEILLPYFQDPFVNIANAKVEMINEHSELIKDAFTDYFNTAFPNKFDKSYVKTGNDEVNEQLGAFSTLINASGLLIRKSSFGETLISAQTFKMCGDWLIYLECLKNGKIVYDINATNYFRRHSASQVKQIEGTETYFLERKAISEFVFENYSVSKQLMMKAFDAVKSEWHRFKHLHTDTRIIDVYNKVELYSKLKKFKKEKLPSIIVVASDFSPGGGQLFSIRLANAWKQIGGNVVLLNVNKHPAHEEILKQIDFTVPVYNIEDIDISDVINVYNIDVIHSSIWWSDKYVHEMYKRLPSKVRWIISMHGCYESLLESSEADKDFMEYIDSMLLEVDVWVYTAEKNKKVFDYFQKPDKLMKVLNGYERKIPKKINKELLGIGENSFVLCLASRAISTKGWYIAVEVVERLNEKGYNVDLLLIGEGEAADEIAKTNKKDFIHLIGQVSNLEDYIAISDVGILPTFFVGESMPLVLIEFMAQGKPIISTDIGEIVDMTSDSEGSAAIILEIKNGSVNVDEFVDAVQRIYNDKKLIKELSVNSKRNFQRFEMSQMIEAYKKIYNTIISD
jgi:glycosyltransferase involved in cell wall biosynthesis